jgi:hypothetical protein
MQAELGFPRFFRHCGLWRRNRLATMPMLRGPQVSIGFSERCRSVFDRFSIPLRGE